MPRFSCLLFPLLVLLVTVVPSAAAPRNLLPQDAAAMLAGDRRPFLLDVRTFEEYRQFRLEGTRLIPIDRLAGRLAEVPRDRPVLVYCAVGSRSAQAVNFLVRQGYPEVYNLSGGIYAWAQQGLPILKGGP